MKKVRRTGKKVLSVFLAVLMVLTTWVFVAPTKASAAAGTYYVRVYYYLVDRGVNDPFIGDKAVDYTGPTMTTASAGVTLYHKADNGTATGDPTAKDYNMKSLMFDNDGTDNVNSNSHIAFSGVGFPTSIQFFAKCATSNYGEWYFKKITVAASSTAEEHTIWEGEVGCQFGGNAWQGEISPSGFKSIRKGSGTWKETSDASNWIYPYADTTTCVWSPKTLTAMTCPKTASDEADTQSVSVTAKDQYGVQMFDPTWSVSGSIKTIGLSVDPSTTSSSTTIKVTNSANLLNTTNSQTGTVTATWAGVETTKSDTITFTVNDAKYDATFTGHRDANGVLQHDYVQKDIFYGVPPTPPTASNYSVDDYDYTFKEWSPSVTMGIVADTTYTAVYNDGSFVSADYTAVDKAIADANALKAQYGTDYELKFTLASRAALNSAINAVVRGLGRTQQSTVDTYASAIKGAMADLEPNKYDVIFLDKDGAILLYEKGVEYKQSVTVPELQDKQKVYYDSTNHYTFKEWDTNEYTSVTDDLVISPVYTAEAHTYTTETVESNCVTKGATKYICSCGYSYIDGESEYGDHVWESDFRIPYDMDPTCTVAGQKSIHCSLCDAQTDITSIDPLGHFWSSQSVAVSATCTNIGLMAKVCDECGICEHTEIPALGHSLKDTVVASTCTEKGYTEHTCQNADCGFSYRDTYTALADHSYPTTGEVIQQATCGVAQITKYTCTACGNVKLESGEVPSHDDVNTMSWTVEIPATCEDDGYRAKICSKCKSVLASEEISATGHTEVADAEVAATCTTSGKTAGSHCSVCSVVIVAQQTVAPLGHDWDEGVIRDADCTHGAHTLYTCERANCGEKKYEVDENSAALGHDYTVFVLKTDADCENNGEEVYKCVRCDKEQKTVIPRLGHNYVAGEAVAPTCTTSGYTPYTCNNQGCDCTYNEYDASKPATGHTWKTTPKSTVNATCEIDGSETYECQNCNAENVVTIPKLGHNYELKSSTKADCTTPATEVYECSVCKDTYTKYVAAANGHTYGKWETVTEATADKNGVQKRVCTVCGDVQYGTIAPIGNHSFKEKITKNATCTETGTKTFTCESHTDCSANYTETIPATGHKSKLVYIAPSCSVEGSTKIICYTCGDTLSDVKTIPMTAHSYDDGKVTTNPTCTTDGEKTFTCSCGATRTEVVAKTGHVLSSSKTDAGCLTTGKVVTSCSKGCGYSVETEIPAKGHTLAVTTNPATCTDKGSVVEECACGYKKTTEIAALGHNFSGTETIVTNASCTTTGSKNVKCINCTVVNLVVIPATGHAYKAGTKVDATCTESGYTPYNCDNCGDTYNKFDENPSGHNFTGGKETVTVRATCLIDGEKTVQCTKCNVTETRLVAKLGHAWDGWVTVDSTATTEGSKTRTCARGCTETVALPKLGHEMIVDENLSTAPKCQVEGEDVYVCTTHTNCGYTLKVKVAPTGHTFDGGKVTTDPTCDTDGIKTFTCLCGVTRTETVAKTGHSLSTTFKKAKCDEKGEVLTKCANCTFEISTEIPATGHTWDNGTETPASCTAEGKIVYACQNDDCSATKEIALDKLQHTFTKKETVAATCLMSAYTVFECKCSEEYYELSGSAKGHAWAEVAGSSTATCTGEGEKTLKCSDCGMTMTVDVPALGHDYKAGTVTPATCTTPASTVYSCTRCSASYTELTATANGHSWSGWENVQAATTDKNGIEKRTCSVCGEDEYRTTQPIGDHVFTETITIPATCDTVGEKTFTCSKHTNCPANYKEEIPATGHTETIATTPATCENPGSTVTSCTVCGDTLATETIPALGHNWSDGTVTKNATCQEKGVISYICLRDASHTKTSDIDVNANAHVFTTGTVTAASCEKDGTTVYSCTCGKNVEVVTEKASGHSWNAEKTVDKAADCTTAGLKSTHCSKCDAIKDAEVIQASGHVITTVTSASNCTEDGTVTESCENCDYTKTTTLAALGHDFSGAETIVKKATCTEDGSKTVKCVRCNETVTVVIPHLGHTWSAWVITDATNTADGLMTRTCSNGTCTEEITIPKGGHVWDDGAVTKNATCTAEGEMEYKCTEHTNCGVTLKVTIPVTQHSVVKDIKKATCIEGGYVKVYCSECDKEFSNEPTEKIAHVYVAGEAVAPTCTTSGYIPYECSCGASYNEYDASKPATGHELVEGISTATCTTVGEMTLTCKNCTYTTKVDVPALGHDYGLSGTTSADCNAAATETYKCSRCTAKYTISVGDKTTDHDWNQWTVVEAATASSLGYETRNCNICSKLEVRTISATGEHNFTVEKDREEATCTVDGWIEYSCATHTDCGLTSKVKIPATGHTETLNYIPATCETTGITQMVCSVESCKEVLKEEIIPELGHAWNDGEVTLATCKAEGNIKYECTRTDCEETYETVLPVNPNAHQYTTTVTDATCTQTGLVVTKCSICNDETTTTLQKKGHTWKDTAESTVEATCEANGTATYKCQFCEANNIVTLPKTGHTWGDWTVIKASTNTDEGEMKRTCAKGCTEKAKIPAGGHDLVEVSRQNASCTSKGSITYDCTVHTGEKDCGISVTVTLDELLHDIETEIKAASCEGEGFVETRCKNCSNATERTVLPATGHTYDDDGVKTNATCTAEGKIVYTCQNNGCNDTKKVVLDKLQHKYVEGTAVAPTCTQSGYTPYDCETCDSAYVIITDSAKGHDYKEGSSTATCEAGGEMTLECACGETTTVKVPALGHNYVLNGTTNATCADEATETYKCSRCTSAYTVSVGSKSTDHDFADWVTVEKATNTSLGYRTRTCKVCDQLEVETIAATGEHVFDKLQSETPATCTGDGKKIYSCSAHNDCGLTSEIVVPANGHTEELSYKAASCSADGYAKIICTVADCNAVIKEQTIPALDHVWGNEKVTNSTCKEAGKVEFTCTLCSVATKTVEIPVDADAHVIKTETELASCKNEGSVTASCTLCGKELYSAELPKLQHIWSRWQVSKEATNTTDGEMKRICDNGCEETVGIPMGGHTFGDTPDKVDAATCEKEGSATYNCKAHANCGVTIKVKLEKVQHAIRTETEDASCTKTGFVKVYCTACGKSYVDVTTGMIAHEFEVVETVLPTCTSSGYTTYKCKNCNEGYSQIGADATGHTWKDTAESTVNATCEENGTATYECKFCEATNVVTIHKTGHSWDGWSVVATPQGDVIKRVCLNNSQHIEEYKIPAGGHSFDFDNPSDTDEGSCIKMGTKTFHCTAHTLCGVSITVATEYGAHNWGDFTLTPGADKDTITRVCKNDENHTESYDISSGGHEYDLSNPETVEGNCKTQGTSTFKCTKHTNCSESITVNIGYGKHSFKTERKDATCEDNGFIRTYCTVCEDTISNEVLEKINHSYDKNGDGFVDANDAVYTPATQNPDGTWNEGYYTYTCQNGECSNSYTENITETFEVRFFDSLGNQIGETQHIKLGKSAKAPADPQKKADGNYHYIFSGWDRKFDSVTKDVDVYPIYNREAHSGGVATCKVQAECEICSEPYGKTDESKHVIVSNTIAATCEKDGKIIYTCSEGCGYLEEKVLKKTNHVFTDWETVVEGNCKVMGVQVRRCVNSECDLAEERTYKEPHSFIITKGSEPTCTKTGITEHKYCVVCEYETGGDVIPVKDHNDVNGDAKCDYCGYSESLPKCTCMCHSEGFMQFIYKIFRFFWIITRTQQKCACGANHW